MLEQDFFTNHDYLSFQSPFYFEKNNEIYFNHNFSEIIEKINIEERMIDPVSVVEFINRFYFFGDRTIIKGLRRTPWMARFNTIDSNWEHADLPMHSEKIVDESKIAEELLVKLKKEILQYCSNKSRIGILLSGGMDSRIVSGVVDILKKEGKLKADIVGLTWGISNSRDVQYAKEICKLLKWDWLHFPLSPEVLNENIEIISDIGCEVSPIHFHAIKQVREAKDIDCILAGSFGDSIGRGEYSGKHVSQIKSLKNIHNWFGLLNDSVFKNAKKHINQDINNYRNLYKRNLEYQYCEIEQQAHYLRRQLNVCLSYISDKIPLFQVFTSPEVFGYIWSLNPKCRTDKIYSNLLNYFDDSFLNIAWARTGKLYLNSSSKSDNFLKENNKYGLWIRNELRNKIEKSIFSETIQNLGIFNNQSLKKVYYQ